MEKYIEKVVKYILDKKFPGFEGVRVTSDIRGYNIFLIINFRDFYFPLYIERAKEIRSLIKNTLKSIGIGGDIKIFNEFSDSE